MHLVRMLQIGENCTDTKRYCSCIWEEEIFRTSVIPFFPIGKVTWNAVLKKVQYLKRIEKQRTLYFAFSRPGKTGGVDIQIFIKSQTPKAMLTKQSDEQSNNNMQKSLIKVGRLEGEKCTAAG
ncbi:hypothetical protein T09_14505 [Trichinella sp. T9]|nr:hypothetical protein T09_14505 [Trichinella sp. T9]